MSKIEASDMRVQDLDHCGLIAGICDDMGLVEQLVDRLLGTHPQEIVTPGQAIKAMILNGLGFVSAPLYLLENFFAGIATEHLLAEGIRPEHLNDDRLGRVGRQNVRFWSDRTLRHSDTIGSATFWCRYAQPALGFEFPPR